MGERQLFPPTQCTEYRVKLLKCTVCIVSIDNLQYRATKTPPTGLNGSTVECLNLGRFRTLNTVTRPPENLKGLKGLN